MSNTIAVVIAVIGILALFAAAGALFAALRKSGSHPVAARQKTAASDAAHSPEQRMVPLGAIAAHSLTAPEESPSWWGTTM